MVSERRGLGPVVGPARLSVSWPFECPCSCWGVSLGTWCTGGCFYRRVVGDDVLGVEEVVVWVGALWWEGAEGSSGGVEGAPRGADEGRRFSWGPMGPFEVWEGVVSVSPVNNVSLKKVFASKISSVSSISFMPVMCTMYKRYADISSDLHIQIKIYELSNVSLYDLYSSNQLISNMYIYF